MTTRGLIAGLVFGLAMSGAAWAAEDQGLRDYDRESLDFLFEQAQSAGPISGISEDDLLITGSIGTTSDKKEQRASEHDNRLPVARPAP
jgi:hypothetical protein